MTSIILIASWHLVTLCCHSVVPSNYQTLFNCLIIHGGVTQQGPCLPGAYGIVGEADIKNRKIGQTCDLKMASS